jgi:hypothetical protein
LLQLFGLNTFLIILFYFVGRIVLLLNKPIAKRFYAGILLSVLALSVMLYRLFPKISYHGFMMSGGGLIGRGIYGFIFKFFGFAGAVIIIFLLFLSAFYIFFKKIDFKRVAEYYNKINSKKIKFSDFKSFRLKIASFFNFIKLSLKKERGLKKDKKVRNE